MKQWFSNNSYNRISFIITVIPYGILVNWLLFHKRYLQEYKTFFKASLVISLVMAIVYILISRFSIAIRKKYLSYHNALKRGILISLFTFVVNSVLITGIQIAFNVTHFLNFSFNWSAYSWSLVATVIVSILLIGPLEGAYALEQWKEIVKETERLQKATLQKKLDKLKEQVNPHFLFNCLNSLSSLISDDTKGAGKFLNELSVVYRYLLHNNEETLATLSQELTFIRSYFHLLETRHVGVNLVIEVEEAYINCHVPPLTMQLLVENAIKHNICRKEKPLYIYIKTTADGRLSVSNNKQLKMMQVFSTGIGLRNIQKKYALLRRGAIEIVNRDEEFQVIVPLIVK